MADTAKRAEDHSAERDATNDRLDRLTRAVERAERERAAASKKRARSKAKKAELREGE